QVPPRRCRHLGIRAHAGPGSRRPARRLPARRILATDGHASREEHARGALGERQGALEIVDMTPSAWKGRRVFVTGHTGFKGSWLTLWLRHMGAHVTGYALAPPTEPKLFALLGLAGYLDSHLGDARA